MVAVLASERERLGDAIRALFASTLGDLGAVERLGPTAVGEAGARHFAALAAPTVLACVLASALVGLVQAGFRTYGELLGPKLERLDPRSGLSKLFSPRKAATEAAVALLRVAVVGGAAAKALSAELPRMLHLTRVGEGAALPELAGSIGRSCAAATAALFVIAAIDYAQSWFGISREMKMTRREREDESRQQDGDPKAKARMKARARALAKKRAMLAVRNADVIVTNPTHVAVALRYGPRDPAPVVIAKGHDDVALRIRAEGRKHGVVILENRALARALDAEVPVGRPVPAAHFAAVARVLAFVYRLRGAGRRGAPSGGRGTRRA